MNKFQDGQIIRNKKSGKPYLIVYMHPSYLLVVDLSSTLDPTPLAALLQRDWRSYARDIDFDCHTITHQWSYWHDPKNIFMLASQIRL